MAEYKSDKELATELTIEYMRGMERTYLDPLLKALCRFYDTIRAGVPAKEGEQTEG